MILRPQPVGALAVRQSAHALLAFQFTGHWGNRATPRPAPRADVRAAVLLHDAGWDDREELHRLGADGAPLAFDTWPPAEQEAIWRAGVERAATRRLLEYPLHPYTLALLAATSNPDARNAETFKEVPPGEPPSASRWPPPATNAVEANSPSGAELPASRPPQTGCRSLRYTPTSWRAVACHHSLSHSA